MRASQRCPLWIRTRRFMHLGLKSNVMTCVPMCTAAEGVIVYGTVALKIDRIGSCHLFVV